MATTPNTNFTSGQIFTAAQANAFPRGLMAAVVSNTTSQTGITGVEVALTSMSITFTAEANRYYKVTLLEPNMESAGAVAGQNLLRIRKTNITGTTLGSQYVGTGIALNAVSSTLTATFTTTAGSTTVLCTAQGTAATQVLNRGANFPALFFIEDIGAA